MSSVSSVQTCKPGFHNSCVESPFAGLELPRDKAQLAESWPLARSTSNSASSVNAGRFSRVARNANEKDTILAISKEQVAPRRSATASNLTNTSGAFTLRAA